MISLNDIIDQLFGRGGQSELARHIGVDPRQVRRWVAGDSPTPRLLLLYLTLLLTIPERDWQAVAERPRVKGMKHHD